ncbi:hypothetical protein EYF80_025258 [Liparis tanakae]|uniref:Uncharacterized protein n=1 Tax=Liparis tanakae TaxID=230148 RepID=A0A4Z2HG48_9TELE|nr:hypothetical protein EYF80_025258 [Liparis tanakae]
MGMSSGHCLGQSRRATLAIRTAIWVAICRAKHTEGHEDDRGAGQSVNTAEDAFLLSESIPHQEDRVEARLSLPLSELLLRRLQQGGVLTERQCG